MKNRSTTWVRVAGVLAAAALGAAALTSCSTETPEGPAAGPQTITLGANSGMTNVDPAKCIDGDWMGCSSIFGTLTEYDPATGQYVPGMAESIESEDGATWTLKLREGVTFTDGTPYDAEAVKYNWERLQNPEFASTGAPLASQMTLTVVDDLTLQIELPTPNFELLAALNSTSLAYIGSPTALEESVEDFIQNPIGAGPFTLENLTPGTQFILAKNPDFWDEDRPRADRFVVKVLTANMFNSLENGEVDIALLSGSDAEKANAAGLPFVPHNWAFGNLGVVLQFQASSPMSDERLREAFALLIDREQITASAAKGSDPAYTPAAPGTTYYTEDAASPKRDVAAAQKLIDAYLADKGLDRVSVRFVYIAGTDQQKGTAELLKAQVEEAEGIEFVLEGKDQATWATMVQASDFDLTIQAVAGLNPYQLSRFFLSNGSNNRSAYANPEVDALFQETRTEADAQRRTEAFQEASALIAQDFAYVPLHFVKPTFYHRTDVTGVQPDYTLFIRPDLVGRG